MIFFLLFFLWKFGVDWGKWKRDTCIQIWPPKENFDWSYHIWKGRTHVFKRKWAKGQSRWCNFFLQLVREVAWDTLITSLQLELFRLDYRTTVAHNTRKSCTREPITHIVPIISPIHLQSSKPNVISQFIKLDGGGGRGFLGHTQK